MLSAGMLTALASSMALRSLGFPSGAPPPRRADIVISLISFVKRRPRLASAAPFLCLIVAHLLCPDMPGSIIWGPKRPGCLIITGHSEFQDESHIQRRWSRYGKKSSSDRL